MFRDITMQRTPAFILGLRDGLPIAAGYLPIAFTFGVVAIQAGLSPWQTAAVSALMFAGASQFVFAALVAGGASVWTLVAAVLLMNVRHVFYGPSLLSRLDMGRRRVPLPVLAFGLTDEVFATAVARADAWPAGERDLRLLGLEIGAYLAWVGGTVLGSVTGEQLLQRSAFMKASLDFVLPALFCALLLECARHGRRQVVFVALAASLVLALWTESYLALVGGMLLGAAVGAVPWPRRHGGAGRERRRSQ